MKEQATLFLVPCQFQRQPEVRPELKEDKALKMDSEAKFLCIWTRLFIYFFNNLHTPCAAPTQDPEIKSPMLKPARHPRLFNVWKWDHLVTQEWQKLSGDLTYLGPVKRDDRACLNEMLGEESTLSPVYNSFTESSQLHTHLSYNWVSFWNFYSDSLICLSLHQGQL